MLYNLLMITTHHKKELYNTKTKGDNMNNNNDAFTLAEVLITLAIIGIVAAITIPSLIQGYKKTEYSSKLKKFYSTMQQAIQMSQIDNGPLENWDFQKQIEDEDGNRDYYANYEYEKTWIKKYILPYIKYNKITDGEYIPPETETEEAVNNPVMVYFADGSTMTTFLGDCFDIVYDVNGEKSPNESGRDQYRYTFCFAASPGMQNTQGFCPYLSGRATSREDAYNRCIQAAAFCSTLLQYDGWEYKDDYPYKL